MSVTSSSARIKYWIGDFDYSTESLTLPVSTRENKFTLSIDEDISTQLNGWDGSTDSNIYVLLSVTFEGENVYTNSGYDSISTSVAPTNPDITIAVDETSGLVETATTNNFLSMVTDSSGDVSNGQYVVTARFVYFAFDTSYGFETGTFTADLDWENKEPNLTKWYDNAVPKLKFTDTVDYTIGGTEADVDTEFSLYPPENRAVVVRTFDNIQNAAYTTYYTGGNEMKYTVLLTYTFTDYIAINAQQVYESFTVFDVDYCKLYDCLNEQWQLYNQSTCSGKLREVRENQLIRANALVTQIVTGLGCERDTLSNVIEEFNELTGCDCGCLEDGVRQLAAENIVSNTNRQSITADSATTEVDLSAGSTIEITVSTDTELNLSNIDQHATYRFVFIADGGGNLVTFPSATFEGSAGSLLDKIPSTSGTLIMDFYAATATKLTLVSDSSA